jgi:hypothetical protein
MAATSVLPFGSAPAARLEAVSATNVSGQVGAIPGARNPVTDRRSFASGPVPAAAVVTNPAQTTASQRPGRLSHLLQADVLLVAQTSLPAGLVSRLRHVSGVVAAVPVDAGRIKVNGVFVNVLGVNPAGFRPFAAGPTARSAALWQNVSPRRHRRLLHDGPRDRVALDKPVRVDGARSMNLPVAGLALSASAGSTLWFPAPSGAASDCPPRTPSSSAPPKPGSTG